MLTTYKAKGVTTFIRTISPAIYGEEGDAYSGQVSGIHLKLSSRSLVIVPPHPHLHPASPETALSDSLTTVRSFYCCVKQKTFLNYNWKS